METTVLERLNLLEQRVRELEDHEAICRLVVSYGAIVDSGQAERAADLWVEDGSYESDVISPCVGREQLVALFEGELHQGLILSGAAHDISYPVVTISGDEAIATNYAKVLKYAGDEFTVWRVVASRWECVRVGHQWRIKRRINFLLNGQADARSLLEGLDG